MGLDNERVGQERKVGDILTRRKTKEQMFVPVGWGVYRLAMVKARGFIDGAAP
jgi:hypothetical protein